MLAILIGQYLLTASGCSIIGFAIGASSDSQYSVKMGIPPKPTRIEPLQKGEHIQIFLKDGNRQDGWFDSFYKEMVDEERRLSIVWTHIDSRQLDTTLVTDIERSIVIENEKNKWVGLEEAASLRKDTRIKLTLKDGQTYKGQFLSLMEQPIGEEEVTPAIQWYNTSEGKHITTQVSEIESIRAQHNQNLKWICFGAGALGDIITVIGISQMEIPLTGIDFPAMKFDMDIW